MKDNNGRMYYKIFFYGNLMRGFPDNKNLFGIDRPPIFRGPCKTTEKFKMTSDGKVAYVNQNFEESQITGELWEVDSRLLQHIDINEGHPLWYERKLVDVDNGEKAYLYFNNRSVGKHNIKDGDFRVFSGMEEW